MVQEEVDMEYLSLCRCIKNTSTDAAVLIEHQLMSMTTGKKYMDPHTSL